MTLCQRPEVSVLPVEDEERPGPVRGRGLRDVVLPAFGVTLEVAGVDEDLDASQESELVKDMLAVVTSFSSRLYGQRSATARALTRFIKSTVCQPDLQDLTWSTIG
ncbi:hypothetical protein ACWD4J_19000 [Streptomyces sp. NPDC002577]